MSFIPVSPDYRLWINGREQEVHHTPVASFMPVSATGDLQVDVEVLFPFENHVVRPLSRGVKALREGARLRFHLSMPANNRPLHLSLECDQDLNRPLFLLLSPLRSDLPKPGPGVHYFESGKVHDIGVLKLGSNETVVVEAGAVVRGAFHAVDAEKIRILGGGILDAQGFPQEKGPTRVPMLRFTRCRDLEVEGITVMGNSGWTVICVGCEHVTYRDVKLLSYQLNGDGFDIVSSRHVRVLDCFGKCYDDCVAIKAKPEKFDGLGGDVSDVLVEGGTYWNMQPGGVLEIGYETQCDVIERITFRDIDVIRVEPENWQTGAVFSIHNGDRAVVRDVVVENIRVEQALGKLFDIKITLSQYSKDSERGRIERVHLKDIHIVDGPLPPSILQGWLNTNIIRGITFENITHLGRKLTSPLDLHLVLERTHMPAFR